MPEEIERCVESVLEDNPEYSKSRAYAICHAQQNRGNLNAPEDASHNELLAALAEQEGECPEGKVYAGDSCVPVEEVDVPPTLLADGSGGLSSSEYALYLAKELAGPIEREELDENTVVFRNMALLDRGVWTDAGSEKPAVYDPAELEVADENTVNIMHEGDSEASEVGHIDPDSWTVEGETGYADVVIDLEAPAGEFADEALQEGLESKGRVAFQGPSIELPPDAYELEHTVESQHPKVVNGEIHGLGLVGLGHSAGPASKTVSFAHQAAERGIAMSDGQSDKALVLQQADMSPVDTLRDTLSEHGFALEDKDDDELKTLAESLGLQEEEEPDDDEPPEEETPEEEPEEDPEEEDMEMSVAELSDRLEQLESEMDNLKQEMMDEDELSEELEDAKADLADADTVAELEDAKEELDKRLSAIEEQEKDPKTLAEGDSSDDIDFSNDLGGVDYNPASGSTSR